MNLRIPAAIVWGFFFLPGVIFILTAIIRLHIDGLFILGVVFLLLWAWLIGVFTRNFWNPKETR